MKNCAVKVLYDFVDLQRKCESENCCLSQKTNRYMLHSTFKTLGLASSQKLIKKLVDRGDIKWKEEDKYEVEAILDYGQERIDSDNEEMLFQDVYLIKWKGWSSTHNTWEPKENLNCDDMLLKFHSSLKLSKTRKKKIDVDHGTQTKQQKLMEAIDDILVADQLTPFKLFSLSTSPTKTWESKLKQAGRKKLRQFRKNAAVTNIHSKAYKEIKQNVKQQLKEWEKQINVIDSNPALITVVNDVDLEGPPPNFVYINKYKPMAGITIADDPIVGCRCTDCFSDKKSCCGANAGNETSYYKNSRVRVPPGNPIYECNKLCRCSSRCFNRVVQHGRKHKVSIFRTDNCRGWGVKAIQRIPKGTFVMEYVGEIVTFEEAERRGKMYDAEGMTYLFDLDYDVDCPYTVDARMHGNVSHFVNHSCDPNLVVYCVWINHLDNRLPHIALFSKKVILKGEELTFDYMMTGPNSGDLSTEQINGKENSAIPISPGSTRQSLSLVSSSPLKVRNATTHTSSGNLTPPTQNSVDFNTPLHIDTKLTDDMTLENVPPTPAESYRGDEPAEKRRRLSISPTNKYRLRCKCGSSNCRQWLC